MTPGVGSNIGIDTSGFDYIEGSGFVMEGLEDKGLDAKSYIQSVLRRHEGKKLTLGTSPAETKYRPLPPYV